MPKRKRGANRRLALGRKRRLDFGQIAVRPARQRGQAFVRKTLLNLAEQKRFCLGVDWSAIPNNSWGFSQNLFANIVTGNTQTTRNGDEIYVEKVVVRTTWLTNASKSNAVGRMVAVMTDFENIPQPAAGPPLQNGGAGVAAAVMSRLIDEEQCVPKLDVMMYANANDATASATKPVATVFTHTINIRKKIHYKDATHMMGTNHLTLCLYNSDFGFLADATQLSQTTYTIYFKDV